MCSGELESLDLFFMWQMIEAAHQDTTTCSLHLDLFFLLLLFIQKRNTMNATYQFVLRVMIAL
jgi:hypothetical protein